MEKIALDVHKRYSFISVDDGTGRVISEGRIEHSPGAVRAVLSGYPAGTPVAVEATGHWYWVVDEIEAAGLVPRLVHAGKAKAMLACANKTDRLDARGLNRLQRTGTLPTVWIPSGVLRDQRELPRARMALVHQRTQLKNRLHGTLAKYGLDTSAVSDLFGRKGRQFLTTAMQLLPVQSAFAAEVQLQQVDQVSEAIATFVSCIGTASTETEATRLLQSLPGVATVLSVVIAAEIGDISRFVRAEQLAAYAGTTPRVHASGGRQRIGRLRTDVNHYLKWAFMEAATVASRQRKRWPQRHVVRLYERLRQKRGHHTAVGAVARHLAEASFWILTKQQCYTEPGCLDRRTSAATL